MMNITAWIKNKYPLIIAVSFAVVVLLSFLFLYPSFHGNEKDTIVIETFRTTDGWGYQIKVNAKVYIYQPFIPVQQKTPFPTKKIARKAARIVKDKLRSGNPPNLTTEDLENIGAIGSEP